MPLSSASPGCNGRLGTSPLRFHTLVADGPLSDLDGALEHDNAIQGMDASHYAWTAQFDEAGCAQADSPILAAVELFDDVHFGHTLRHSHVLDDWLAATAHEYRSALDFVYHTNASSQCAGARAPGTSYGADAMWEGYSGTSGAVRGSSGALAFTAVEDATNAAAALPRSAFDHRVVNVLPVGGAADTNVGFVVLPAGIGFGGSVVFTQNSSSSSLQAPSASTGETGRLGIRATGGGTVNGATSTIFALQLSTAATSMTPKLAKSFVICAVTGWSGSQTEELSVQQLSDSTLVATDATQWKCTEFKDIMPTSPPTLAPTSSPPTSAPTTMPADYAWDFTGTWVGGILLDSTIGTASMLKSCALMLSGGSDESYAKLVNLEVPLNQGWSIEGWFRLGDTNTFAFSYAVPSNDNCILIYSGFPQATATWTHVVLAVDPSNNIDLYYDGVIDTSRKYTSSFCGISGGTLVFGNDQDSMLVSGSSSRPNDASQAGLLEIANIKLHAKTLAPGEIAAYRRDNTGPTDNPDHINTRVGWWDFCESSGTYTYNKVPATSPAAQHGWTIAGDIETGAVGNADRWFATAPDAHVGLTLQGAARDYVELDGADFHGSTTLEFHVQFHSMVGGMKLIDCGAGESNQNVYIASVTPAPGIFMLELSVVRGDGSGADSDNVAFSVLVDVSSVIVAGAEYHIVWTIATLEFKLFINGNPIHTETFSNQYSDATPPSVTRRKCYLGKGNYAADQMFAGSISFFKIYQSVLSSSKVAELYAVVAPTSAPTSSPTAPADPSLWANGFSSHFVHKFSDGEWGPAGAYFAYYNDPNCGGVSSAYHKAVMFERMIDSTSSMRYPSSRTTQCSDNNENTPSSIYHAGDGAGGSNRILQCGRYGTTECGAFGASVMPIATFPGGECAVAASSLKLRSAFYGVSSGHAAAPAVFDFDGDGDLDLLLGGLDGRAQLYENVGTTAIDFDGEAVDIIAADRFVAIADSPPTPFSVIATDAASRYAVGDLNGDGLGDIAVGAKNGTVAIFLARCTGS